MNHKHAHHKPAPFMLLAFGLLIFVIFGWKAFAIVPFLFMFGGVCRHWGVWDGSDDEKPKRKGKPKRDVYADEDDDVTYV